MENEEQYIPKMTEDPDNIFVNFISLAESVALAPTLALGISIDVLWLLVLEDFVLLTEELAFALLLFWSSS